MNCLSITIHLWSLWKTYYRDYENNKRREKKRKNEKHKSYMGRIGHGSVFGTISNKNTHRETPSCWKREQNGWHGIFGRLSAKLKMKPEQPKQNTLAWSKWCTPDMILVNSCRHQQDTRTGQEWHLVESIKSRRKILERSKSKRDTCLNVFAEEKITQEKNNIVSIDNLHRFSSIRAATTK